MLITLLVLQPCMALQATGGGQRLKLLEITEQMSHLSVEVAEEAAERALEVRL